MEVSILVGFFLLLTLHCTVGYKRYDGYQLFQLFPTKDQVDRIRELTSDIELDFWHESFKRQDILVSPHKLSAFTNFLTKNKIRYEIASHNIQNDIDAETAQRSVKTWSASQPVDYDNFNTYADIMDELDNLVARCPPGYSCETFLVGQSYEGRDIKGMRIYSGTGRQAIWLDATIHAREWLSTATHLKIMKHLVDDYADSEVGALLSTYDWYLIPIMNPDGYVFTHTDERLWRKNRSPNSGSNCLGTDLNRNYDQMWSNAGSSNLACSDTYHGSGPASEVETSATQSMLDSVAPSLSLAIHFHTYGQLWLMPWGSVTQTGGCNYAEDSDEMMVVANAAADAIEATHGTTWERGNSCEILYPASGMTMDYTKGVAGVKYAFLPELRGNSFIVNANQIQPSYEEVWNGLTAAITAVENAK